jgi:hypothetical protein
MSREHPTSQYQTRSENTACVSAASSLSNRHSRRHTVQLLYCPLGIQSRFHLTNCRAVSHSIRGAPYHLPHHLTKQAVLHLSPPASSVVVLCWKNIKSTALPSRDSPLLFQALRTRNSRPRIPRRRARNIYIA